MYVFDIMLACLDRHSSGVLATVVRRTGSAPRDVGAKMFVTDEGKVFGTGGFAKSLIRSDGIVVGDHVDRQAINRCVVLTRLCQTELSERTFAEPIKITVPLYIFGAGHVSQHLSRIAKAAGFFVTVIDDRKEFADSERFGDANVIIRGHFPDVLSSLDFTGNEYVVIVTRSQKQDALVLGEVLKRSAKYVGMMGSRRKVGIILDRLHEKGFDREATSGVCAPIGIDIDAETPQEVAVSIVAEMIKVKNAKH